MTFTRLVATNLRQAASKIVVSWSVSFVVLTDFIHIRFV